MKIKIKNAPLQYTYPNPFVLIVQFFFHAAFVRFYHHLSLLISRFGLIFHNLFCFSPTLSKRRLRFHRPFFFLLTFSVSRHYLFLVLVWSGSYCIPSSCDSGLPGNCQSLNTIWSLFQSWIDGNPQYRLEPDIHAL